MMANFSFAEAMGAGFKILGRRPLAVLIWAVAYLLLVAGPGLALSAWVLPQMIAALREAAPHALAGQAPVSAEAIALRSNFLVLEVLLWLMQLVVHSVLMGAIFRAVLTPDESRWSYLRLSRQELWLGLTNLVFTVVAAIMILTLFIPLGIGLRVGMTAARSGHVPGPASLPMLLAIAGVGLAVIVWLLLRLCLALPMAFATRRFALYESWGLTRGHVLKIFGVILVLAVIIWLFEFATLRAGGTYMVSQLLGGANAPSTVKGSMSDILRHLAPAFLAAIALGSLVAMIVYTVVMAPIASIYQQLTRGPGAA
jgi:hypothetical protein